VNNLTYDRRDFLKVASASSAIGTLVGCAGGQEAASVPAPDRPASSTDLCFMNATELAALIRARKAYRTSRLERCSNRASRSTWRGVIREYGLAA
jgi:hypothetical protein